MTTKSNWLTRLHFGPKTCKIKKNINDFSTWSMLDSFRLSQNCRNLVYGYYYQFLPWEKSSTNFICSLYILLEMLWGLEGVGLERKNICLLSVDFSMLNKDVICVVFLPPLLLWNLSYLHDLQCHNEHTAWYASRKAVSWNRNGSWTTCCCTLCCGGI